MIHSRKNTAVNMTDCVTTRSDAMLVESIIKGPTDPSVNDDENIPTTHTQRKLKNGSC